MHNKAGHCDVYYIAASPLFRSRSCWLALSKKEIGNWLKKMSVS
jgi:hypothetical protein